MNKPRGVTSRRVVDRVARFARKLKVGHAGTLDPLATGVLVLCVGPATRLIPYIQQAPKRYRGTFLLGRESPTEDVEGEVTELDDPPVPSREQIARAAGAFRGEIQQRPPAYSALKVAGRRAYDLARQGQAVELKPRPVLVYRIEVVDYAYPELTLDIECGAGTYIRSLGRDLAHHLGTAAVLSRLVRTAVGGFTIEEASGLDDLTRGAWQDRLLPPLRAVDGLPQVVLDEGQAARVRQGQRVPTPPGSKHPGPWAGVNRDGSLVAVLVPRGRGRLGPSPCLPAGSG